MSASLVFAALLAGAPLGGGQSSVPSESRVHAIVGARVEVGDGRVFEKATLVVRDGVIVAVAENAPVPAGAQILDGKGLTLTPGFIDAWTDRGTSVPETNADKDAAPSSAEYASASMREANRRGVRPEIEARQYLNVTEEFARPYRSAGFTTAMIVPGSGYIAGVGTLVNLSGRPARESVVVSQTALAIDFDGNAPGGGYPGSLLGRIAQVRQAFEDARGLQTSTAAYSGGSSQRPPSDPTLEALMPVFRHTYPLVIEGDTPAQIDRAVQLGEELHLRPILVGALQAYKCYDRLRASRLILGLNFGEEPKAVTKSPEDNQDDTPPDSPEMLTERSRLYNEAARNALILHDKGVRFALTTRGTKDVGEFMTRLRAAVKNGLPREVALKALTIGAAQIFGVSRNLGTLEVGKTANIVAFTGDFLDEKTRVKMIYIDGRRIDPEAKPTPPAPNRAPGVVDLP